MFRRYRQFEGMTEEEVSAQLREQAAERRGRALARVEPVDLSATTWPEYPPSTVVNAITYAARRGLHRYLDRHATALRSELAHAPRRAVQPQRPDRRADRSRRAARAARRAARARRRAARRGAARLRRLRAARRRPRARRRVPAPARFPHV